MIKTEKYDPDSNYTSDSHVALPMIRRRYKLKNKRIDVYVCEDGAVRVDTKALDAGRILVSTYGLSKEAFACVLAGVASGCEAWEKRKGE